MASKQSKSFSNEEGNADLLKAQHAVIYSKSTSDIKDDLPALTAVLRTGHGPLSRQEAAFLVFHHVLDGSDKQLELAQAGLVNVCLGLLEANASDVAAPEKTCACGILASLCEAAEVVEAVAKGRVGNTTACTIFHQLLQEQRSTLQVYATKCLHLLAAMPMTRTMLLRCMDNQLLFGATYVSLLLDCQNAQVVTHLALYLTALVNKRDDLQATLVAEGHVEATLEALQKHKKDSAIQALLQLLLSLLEYRAAWSRLVEHGGIRVLVDLLGPPPRTIMDMEMKQHRTLLDPAGVRAQTLPRKEHTEEAAEAADVTINSSETVASENTALGGEHVHSLSSSHSAKARAVHPWHSQKAKDMWSVDAPELDTIPAVQPSTLNAQDVPLLANANMASSMQPRAAMAQEDLNSLLSINKSGLKWHAIASLQTHCLAAGCLYWLAQDAAYMGEMSNRLATSRLVPLLQKAMGDDGSTGKKKGKRKALSLSHEQTQMLVHVTGCLKFLSLVNTNRYRIAALGAVKPLSILYHECSHTLLRRNAQVILTNIALLGENGQLLLDGGLPEEFLVPRPLRLSQQDVQHLKQEFPDAAFLKASAATSVPGIVSAAVVKVI